MKLFARLFAAAVLLGGAASAQDAAPTFARDVAPILFSQCAVCHRAGEIGPFPLLDYADAKKRAKQIALVAERRTMPPWKPEPGHGEFLDERRLTEAQIALLRRWADQGAPEGDRADLPAVPVFPSGWKLGEPDLVLKMPQPFTVPAEGPDLYMHFVLPVGNDADKYLRAVEVRPGNPRVAHHAIGLIDGSGTARRLAEKHGGGYPGLGNPGFVPIGFTPGYVPGQTPRFMSGDTAITLRKGTDFVLQMHYHPVGKVETDQTMVGFHFTDKKPRRNPTGILLGSEDIEIAAGAKGYTRTDTFVLPADLEAHDIWAHMHLVGKAVRVWADLPDGTQRPILRIADWDFNWQDIYRFAKPFRLPKGAKVHVEFVYDNSSDNPRNPNAPPKVVRFGPESGDEMAGLWIGGLAYSPQDETAFLLANVGHYGEIQARKKKDKRP